VIKRKSICILTSFLLATASLAPVLAQADALEDHMRQVRRKVVEKRDSAMGTLIELTDEQEDRFRPIQKEYDKELKQLGKKDRALIREFAEVYDKLDASTAEGIGKRFFELQRERLEIQERYLRRISDEVSPVVAVLFIQLQRRFEAQLETERMKYSPLAE
jgi:Spy/CpxP family protein refolding chaperone